jgi:cytochrome c oxidase subunit 2
MLKDKDIKILVGIWVVGTLLAVLCGWLTLAFYTPGTAYAAPTPQDATTWWLFQPATTIAELVRQNTAWTCVVILPFLFAPIMTLLFIIVRFSEKNSPRAANYHEHLPLEIFWTIVPAVVLVAMAVPAYRVLRYMEKPPAKPDVVVDITGAQFFWKYSLPEFDVLMTDDGTGTDPLVLPIDNTVLLAGSSSQVNHAWWVPAFGVKFDVIPGRITTSWIKTTKEGFFKGQCAELCGELHAYMLIHVKVVPEKEYYQWLQSKGAKFRPEHAQKVAKYLGNETPKS